MWKYILHFTLFFFSSLYIVRISALPTYNFLFHGDWGWASFNQSVVAEQMGIYASQLDAQFVIALGDNFYEDGIDNTTDPLWNKAYKSIYTAESLQVPWYPILGNHDYHVNIQAQIDRTYVEGENSWTFPSNYFVQNYALNDGGMLAILYIDTQILDPDHGDTSIIYENENWESDRQKHLDWIDETLSQQKKMAQWVIVCGHYPIYSVGVNGDNKVLASNLLPILRKHQIHMYIAGHDHNHQYIPMNDGITYVVSGQSAGRGPFGAEAVKFLGISNSSQYIVNYFSECGFGYAEVDSNVFRTTFVNAKGDIKFVGTMMNPNLIDGNNGNNGSPHYDSHPDSSSFYAMESSPLNVGLLIITPTIVLTLLVFVYVHRKDSRVVYLQSKVYELFNLRQQGGADDAVDDSTRSVSALTGNIA